MLRAAEGLFPCPLLACLWHHLLVLLAWSCLLLNSCCDDFWTYAAITCVLCVCVCALCVPHHPHHQNHHQLVNICSSQLDAWSAVDGPIDLAAEGKDLSFEFSIQLLVSETESETVRQ